MPCQKFNTQFYPLLPSAHKSARFAKMSIIKLEGTIKEISCERRNYESADEKRQSLRLCLEKIIQAVKG